VFVYFAFLLNILFYFIVVVSTGGPINSLAKDSSFCLVEASQKY